MDQIKFTTEQREFIDYIIQSVNNNVSGIVILNAPAGTGKTTCIRYIIDKLKIRAQCVLCPTRKSASLFPSNKAKTLHSYFKIHPTYDDSGNLLFKCVSLKCPFCEFSIDDPSESAKLNEHAIDCSPSKEEENQIGNVIFVDECSMITKDMFTKLLHNSKTSLVVFCGDDAQIPPNEEEYSMAFNYKYTLKRFTFTESMRSKNDKIRKYNDKFRKAITANNEIYVSKIGHHRFIDDFLANRDAIVLSYTNKQRILLNELIRRALFSDDRTELKEFYPNERLIFTGYRNVREDQAILRYIYKDELPSEPWIMKRIDALDDYTKRILRLVCDVDENRSPKEIYGTSDTIIVSRVTTHTLDIPYYRCPHQSELCKGNFKLLKKCQTCGIVGKNKSFEQITFHHIVDDCGNVWRKVASKSVEDFKTLMKYYASSIVKAPSSDKWRNFYTIQYLLDPMLEYHYAITIHKSQGSQYDHVYVNIDNVRRNNYISDETKARLLYTAVSRAVCNIEFINSV